jgi:protein-tyrosine kinase
MSKIEEALIKTTKLRESIPGESAPKEYISRGSVSTGGISINSDLDMEENMISLFHSINSLLPDFQKKVIQFIGSSEEEGTSTIVREFAAVSVNKFGKKVLLMDTDTQKPSQHLFFNINPTVSCEDVFRDGKPSDNALNQIESSGLFLSAISNSLSSTAQIFESLNNSNFWEKMRSFDLVLIDSPPAATSSDGLYISRMVDGVVLVLEAEKTRWPLAKSMKDKIIRNGGKVLGIVFNKHRHHIPEFIYKRL